MKVAFVCMGAENLGVEYLSAVLEQEGHQTELFFDPSLFDDKLTHLSSPFLSKALSKKEKILKSIIESRPDFIAFSVMTDTYQWACSLAKELWGRTGAKIIFGGIHASSVPEEVIQNDFVDYAVIGEGEYALLDLVEGRPDSPNIWSKKNGKIIKRDVRPLIKDLDTLPFPNKKIFEKYFPIDVYMTLTSRGCPFDCTYCCNSILLKLYGTTYRKRSVMNVAEELIRAKERYAIKNIKFVDDVFTEDKKRLREFLEIYKEKVGIPFSCSTHPFFVNDEVAELLKGAGCVYLEIGVQSSNEMIKKNVLNRPETNSDVAKALSSCEKFGLKVHVDYIVGLPGEEERDLVEACYFFIEHKPWRFNYFYLTCFPRTEIIKFANLTPERIAAGEKGIEPMYLEGGRTRSLTARCFEIMFKLVPLLPRPVSRIILKAKIYRIFGFLGLSLLVDVLTLVKTREIKGLLYLKKLFANIFK